MGCTAEAVRVVARVRPLGVAEVGEGVKTAVTCEVDESGGGPRVVVGNKENTRAQVFRCNGAFGAAVLQDDMFQHCGAKDVLNRAISGYAGTVFAYGQTGSGKTFTILGDDRIIGGRGYSGHSSDGLTPRAARELFEVIGRRSDRAFAVRATVLEVYNEQVFDLLSQHRDGTAPPLAVRHSPKLGFYVEDLTEVPCSSVKSVYTVLSKAIRARRVAAHKLNTRSSRGHMMVTLHIDSTPVGADSAPGSASSTAGQSASGARQGDPPTYGRISFVDLAGSERLGKSESEGTTRSETGHINRSLFTLGKVIAALAKQERGRGPELLPSRGGVRARTERSPGRRMRGSVAEAAQRSWLETTYGIPETGTDGFSTPAMKGSTPMRRSSRGSSRKSGRRTPGTPHSRDVVSYRDSKLTMLLRESLGGRGVALMVACTSPGANAVAETLRTLHFAMGVKRVRNRAVVLLDPQQRLIKELRDEIARLRAENEALRASGAGMGLDRVDAMAAGLTSGRRTSPGSDSPPGSRPITAPGSSSGASGDERGATSRLSKPSSSHDSGGIAERHSPSGRRKVLMTPGIASDELIALPDSADALDVLDSIGRPPSVPSGKFGGAPPTMPAIGQATPTSRKGGSSPSHAAGGGLAITGSSISTSGRGRRGRAKQTQKRRGARSISQSPIAPSPSPRLDRRKKTATTHVVAPRGQVLAATDADDAAALLGNDPVALELWSESKHAEERLMSRIEAPVVEDAEDAEEDDADLEFPGLAGARMPWEEPARGRGKDDAALPGVESSSPGRPPRSNGRSKRQKRKSAKSPSAAERRAAKASAEQRRRARALARGEDPDVTDDGDVDMGLVGAPARTLRFGSKSIKIASVKDIQERELRLARNIAKLASAGFADVGFDTNLGRARVRARVLRGGRSAAGRKTGRRGAGRAPRRSRAGKAVGKRVAVSPMLPPSPPPGHEAVGASPAAGRRGGSDLWDNPSQFDATMRATMGRGLARNESDAQFRQMAASAVAWSSRGGGDMVF